MRARTLFARLGGIPRLHDRAFLARQFDDFYHYLPVLLNSNDKMTMAASVEARVPFLESELIDFGLHLAPEFKYRHGKTKRVVKESARGLLPPGIIDAPKLGFTLPEGMMRGYEGLLRGGMVPELFKWGQRESERLHEVVRLHWGQLGRRLLTLELWAQLHLNGRTPEEMAERLRAVRRI